MKILFILPEYPGVGGINTVSALIAEELIRRGHSVDFLSQSRSNSRAAKEIKGVKSWLMPDIGKAYSPANNQFAVNLVKDNHYDVIIFQDSYDNNERIAVNAARQNGVKLIVAEHNSPLFIYNKRDLDPWYSIKGILRHILHPYLLKKDSRRKRFLFDNCHRYVLLAESFREEFSFITGINANHKKLRVINNPVKPVATDGELSKKENICIFVGRLVKEKQVDKLLKIWKSLSKELPDFKFIILGDGPERKNLESIATNHNIPNVDFVGYRNPREYYKKAKFLFLCSKMEGWGMILVEAMQYGCVPVSLDSYSSLKYIIDDNRNGIIIGKENNTAEWTSRISHIASNDDLQRKMGKEAIKKSARFGIKEIATEWERLIME